MCDTMTMYDTMRHFQIQCVTQWDISNTMCDKWDISNTMCDKWDISNTMCDNETNTMCDNETFYTMCDNETFQIQCVTMRHFKYNVWQWDI